MDQKKGEVADLRKENETLQDEIGQNKEDSIKVNGKLDELKERELTQKKRVYECLQSIVSELSALGDYSAPPKFIAGDSDRSFIEEDVLAHVRIFVSKIASDSVQKLNQTANDSEAAKQLEVAEQEVQKLRIQVQQNESTRTAKESHITELKSKVQKLEDEVTALNLKLAGSSSGGASQAVEELRQIVQKKNEEIKSIQAKLQTLQTEKDKLQQEYERLKNDEFLKEKRLKDLSALRLVFYLLRLN